MLVLPEYLMEYRCTRVLVDESTCASLPPEAVGAGRHDGASIRQPGAFLGEFLADWKGAAPWTKLSHERLLLADWLFAPGGSTWRPVVARVTAGLQLALGTRRSPLPCSAAASGTPRLLALACPSGAVPLFMILGMGLALSKRSAPREPERP